MRFALNFGVGSLFAVFLLWMFNTQLSKLVSKVSELCAEIAELRVSVQALVESQMQTIELLTELLKGVIQGAKKETTDHKDSRD